MLASTLTSSLTRWRANPLWRTATFAFSGGMGFLVDAGILQLLAGVFGVQVHFARLVSFLVAVTVTWQINRNLTFANEGRRGSLLREWLSYLASSLLGGATNYGAFALSIYLSGYIREHLVIGVAIGSLAGMLVNYTLYSRFVFKRS